MKTFYIPLPGVVFCLLMEKTSLGEALEDKPACRLAILLAECACWMAGALATSWWLA